ncbi:hypothetical protein GCM10022225_79420 [Plantactinospora mayteni]|uniref:Uncharacterized protein n=1 Tax=Plantactinospora mayteni TaxID=566021 RepID=A0ABQ4F3C3_9ACTN|nr:hypothetical protein [Plantactinospora mayteni]GIH01398.1 hypothetical protein Pma05_79700 [Plantactinospora mayteni]
MTATISRRILLRSGGLGLLLSAAAPSLPAVAGRPRRRQRVLLATNEPWGTYHAKPLLAEATRRGWELVQVVPDLSGITPGDPVPVTILDRVRDADLLVVNGAGDWPADCAAELRHLPLAASSLAYLQPKEAPRAKEFRRRLEVVTAGGPAEATTFASYLGWHRKVEVVGSPQTDDLPKYTPQRGRVLVLTSVTRPDPTGGAAPGTELLLEAAARLKAAGKHIVVGLHPREDRTLWDRYEISPLGSVPASATAEYAIGIPGTVFPLIAAVGVPLVGCVDPRLSVPDYILRVCSSTINSADQAVAAVAAAKPASRQALHNAVGPIGGSARRLYQAWKPEMHGGKHDNWDC